MNSDKDGKVMNDDLHIHFTHSTAASKQPAAADLLGKQSEAIS